jgi:hypothetical protein
MHSRHIVALSAAKGLRRPDGRDASLRSEATNRVVGSSVSSVIPNGAERSEESALICMEDPSRSFGVTGAGRCTKLVSHGITGPWATWYSA